MRQVELKIANAYANQRVKRDTGRFKREDWKEIAVNVYGEDVKPLHYFRVQRVMNQPEVMKLAETRIIQLLDEANLPEKEAPETLKTVKEMAIANNDAKTLLQYAKLLIELRDQMPTKTKITEQRTYNNADLGKIDGVINEAKEQKRKVTISQTVKSMIKEIDENSGNEEKQQ